MAEERIIIEGGNRLTGTISTSGSKNAVLPVIAAALLSSGQCRIGDVPKLADVDVIIQVLEGLGASLVWDGKELCIDAARLSCYEASDELVSKMRASFLVMGPLLARMGKAKVSMPGGCAIGARPVDLHIKGFEAMGASARYEEGYVLVETSGLKGARIYLDSPSVGATENLMMAAALAKGPTVLENAAEEPEIVDLANFINSMGGRIRGAGTKIIKIDGVSQMDGCEHQVIPDRIEAGSFLVAAAMTGGELIVENMIPDHIKPVIDKLLEVGCEIDEGESSLYIRASGRMKAADITTLPYPGFPTDMQAQFMTLMTKAQGASVITETIFENRFMHAEELRRMGADIRINGRSAVVEGPSSLQGAAVKASDLRAGIALIIAALAAEGKSEIGNVYMIDRGYDGLVDKLQGVGADIRRGSL
ncbi:MAG: UDP-N-acetylglucosamine 1-carboxyvinyltransferase [Clostridiales bacterium]|nr:UDP-N-acetylglucosamine 1-carboxyvinyltransferase [Clostridiales bacterium]